MPRTGFPPLFKTLEEYQNYVDTLVSAQVIKDASFIWWVIRPSLQHPTLELRIADVCTRLDDAICIAAIFRCLVRHLVEQTDINADLSAIGLAIAVENKWRAQRYGTAVNFVDHQSMQAKPIAIVLEDLLERLADDAEALSCTSEIAHARDILKRGSSADEQLKVYGNARMEDRSRQAALKDVVDWLCKETTSGIG